MEKLKNSRKQNLVLSRGIWHILNPRSSAVIHRIAIWQKKNKKVDGIKFWCNILFGVSTVLQWRNGQHCNTRFFVKSYLVRIRTSNRFANSVPNLICILPIQCRCKICLNYGCKTSTRQLLPRRKAPGQLATVRTSENWESVC